MSKDLPSSSGEWFAVTRWGGWQEWDDPLILNEHDERGPQYFKVRKVFVQGGRLILETGDLVAEPTESSSGEPK